jgi:hypothetical protein
MVEEEKEREARVGRLIKANINDHQLCFINSLYPQILSF